MMGLIRTPKLYRCGINAVGVTDLDLFMDATWTDYARSDSAEYTLVDLMGDRSRFEEVNPVAQARRIESPVLLAYGSEDRRVPIEHGTRMRSALDKAGKPYEWMLIDGEGHGFRDPKNVRAYYAAVEAFLATHLKPDAASPPASR
jgi:dipeptidyl aminopeptidase/acylaminoacyl peptidase